MEWPDREHLGGVAFYCYQTIQLLAAKPPPISAQTTTTVHTKVPWFREPTMLHSSKKRSGPELISSRGTHVS
jgi:hypothetical protein